MIAHVALTHIGSWQHAFRAAASIAPSVAHNLDTSSFPKLTSALLNEAGFWHIALCAWALTGLGALAAALACGSLGFAPTSLASPTRISSRMGLRRLVSPDSALQTAGAVAVVVIVAMLCVPVHIHQIIAFSQTGDLIAQSFAAIHAAAIIGSRALVAVALVAAIDVVVQRRTHAVRIRMTPRELREERAQTEGRPEARQRRRTVGLRRIRGLRIDAVRRATAVITNPTHVAVALRYAPPLIDVPVVVVRAAGLMVPIVHATARAWGVPIVESPELARRLYADVDVDEAIPEGCYAAVAALFTWIIATHGKLRRGDEEST